MTPGTDWTELPVARLWARAFRTGRADVAFWKHLFESFEDVALVRTAVTQGDECVVALVAPEDFVGEADEILADVVCRGSPPVAPAELPAACREDWFLAEWRNEPDPYAAEPETQLSSSVAAGDRCRKT